MIHRIRVVLLAFAVLVFALVLAPFAHARAKQDQRIPGLRKRFQLMRQTIKKIYTRKIQTFQAELDASLAALLREETTRVRAIAQQIYTEQTNAQAQASAAGKAKIVADKAAANAKELEAYRKADPKVKLKKVAAAEAVRVKAEAALKDALKKVDELKSTLKPKTKPEAAPKAEGKAKPEATSKPKPEAQPPQ